MNLRVLIRVTTWISWQCCICTMGCIRCCHGDTQRLTLPKASSFTSASPSSHSRGPSRAPRFITTYIAHNVAQGRHFTTAILFFHFILFSVPSLYFQPPYLLPTCSIQQPVAKAMTGRIFSVRLVSNGTWQTAGWWSGLRAQPPSERQAEPLTLSPSLPCPFTANVAMIKCIFLHGFHRRPLMSVIALHQDGK